MFKKTHLFICAIVVLISSSVSAQKLIRKAEIQVENGDYSKATENYKHYLTENPNDYVVMTKLAETLALSGNLTQADAWYQAIPANAVLDPSVYKSHGDLLKKMGHYKEAMLRYQLFRNFNPALADHCIKSCEFAINSLPENPAYETFVLPCNSSGSDFGLTFYKGMPVFSSFREDILMTENERELNGSTVGAVKTFYYNADKNRIAFVKGMDDKIYHMGPISFSSNGLSCAIIESRTEDTYNFIHLNKMSSLHIASINEKGEIVSSKPFLYNEVGSSINSAQMAFDGTAIYFSSDRPGGFGGYDIYVSYFNNNVWSLPENLGNNINTEGNEITPFLNGNTLYFASDFHIGLGGYDIVKSEVINGVWLSPTNAGAGINTPSDDYFPVLNSLGELFLTSNRLGGKGSNDIYKTIKLQDTKQVAEEYSFVPQAVSLDALAEETQKHTVQTELATSVSLKEGEESKKVSFSLPEFDTKKIGSNASASVSLEGAHRIGLDDIIPNTEVFFIQLASMSSSKPNFDKFKPLLRYGNIYKMLNNKTIKVRLGYFTDRKEAEGILAKVRANGYKDAFIAFEILNTAVMELILTGTDEESFTDKGNFNTKNPEVEKSYKTGNKYKVRLASYEDPIWFDVNKVRDLGRIEQWTKGGWTIFILAGYNDLEEAKKAQIQAINRGFKTSEVVIDNGGILERLKQN
ncbi:MAG: tetratricopeptide repeat protein [Saprospiraceae bacterium]|nr:tetratricopeptide repeat protein [Saprospiraceae bacterium]